MNVNQTKIKVTPSTSTVNFNNTAHAFYDMIITVQSISISQTINIYDVEGNLINDKPLYFNYPIKIILKDVALGSISFSDVNNYNVILSYVIKSSPEGITYIDFINETSVHPVISTGAVYIPENGFTGNITIDYSTLLSNANVTNPYSLILIQAIYYSYTSSTTGTYTNMIGIDYSNYSGSIYSFEPTGEGTFPGLIGSFNTSVTSGDLYAVNLNQSIYQSGTGVYNNRNYTLFPLPVPIAIVNGESLFIVDGESTNTSTLIISYQVIS